MKLNLSKTECILLGPLKGQYTNIDNITVNNTCVKVLGIHIGHDKDLCYKNNWNKKIDDVEKLFESWKKRKLTIFGKVCLINTLAISKFIYTASILDYPNDETIKLLNKSIFHFIWNKRDRIKRNTMIGNISEGGISLIDIKSKIKSLKASWVGKIYSSNASLKDFINSFCIERNTDIDYILKTSATVLNDFELISNFNNFYAEIFIYFNSCKKCQNINDMKLHDVLCQPLWCNKLFQIKENVYVLTIGYRVVSDM